MSGRSPWTLVAGVLWGGCLGAALVAVYTNLAVATLPGEWRLIVAVVTGAHLAAAALVHLAGRRGAPALVEVALPVLVLAVLWLPGLRGTPVTPAASPEEGAELPHLALITVDGVHLDDLGLAGATFTQCVTTSLVPSTAHASMLTGKRAHDHGVDDHHPLEGPTVVRTLRRQGYRTGAFLSSSDLDRRTGLQRGFNHWDDRWGWSQRWGWSPVLGMVGASPDERPGEQTVERALTWVLASARPTFLWVHLRGGGAVDDMSDLLARLPGEWAVVVVGSRGEPPDLRETGILVPLVVRAPWVRQRELHILTSVRRVKDLLLTLSSRQSPVNIGERMVEVHLPGGGAGTYRLDGAKLVGTRGGSVRYYDLHADPGESRPLDVPLIREGQASELLRRLEAP